MTAVAALPFTARYPLFMRTALAGAWVLGLIALFAGTRLAINAGGIDAHAYWLTGQGPLDYTRVPGARDAFLYSPLFADLIHPIAVLPWPIFWAVWTVLEVAVLVWLVWPLPIVWAVPVALLAVPELANGNIYIFLAAAAVLGRAPTVWLFPVLTKVTTGVGLVWFAARGEWRRLIVPAVAVVVVVGVSLLLQPAAWHGWIGVLAAPGGTRDGLAGFLVRCVAGIALTVVAARKGWAWLLPVAMVIVAPVSAVTTLTMLIAVPRLSTASSPRRCRSSSSPAS